MVIQALKFFLSTGLLLASLAGSAAWGAALTVNTLSDADDDTDGFCSLREAITAANNNTDYHECTSREVYGNDTITFSVNGTITLVRHFELSPPLWHLEISDPAGLTIDGGHAITITGDSGLQDGGAIANGGTLTISKTIFAGCNAFGGGGAILNNGTLTVSNSTFSGNSAQVGGAIFNRGTLTVSNSTFSGNGRRGSGAIANVGTGTVTNSSFSGNSVLWQGGAIGNDGTLTVSNSTFSGNSVTSGLPDSGAPADGDGGGAIYNRGTLTVGNSTLSGNSALGAISPSDAIGGGILNRSTGTLNLKNTIVADSVSGGDCVNDGGVLNASGINLVEDGSCDASSDPAHFITGDPVLGDLADNGGPTLTHALLAGSPAIDQADNAICADPLSVNGLDQRGVARPQDGNGDGIAVCDIGAFELQAPVDACTTTATLDDFDRHDGPIGRRWRGQTDTHSYRIRDDHLEVRQGGPVFWDPDRFDANQAAFVTLSGVDTGKSAQGVLLKVQDGDGPHSGRHDHEDGWDSHNGKDRHDGKDGASSRAAIAVAYDGRAQAVRISTFRFGAWDWRSYGKTPVAFGDGDKLGGCVLVNGNVRVYKNDVLVTTVTLNSKDQRFFNNKKGKIGIWSQSAPHAVLDDFGGGTVKTP